MGLTIPQNALNGGLDSLKMGDGVSSYCLINTNHYEPP